MDKIVLISLPVEDLQYLIVDCVKACLKNHQFKQIRPTEEDELLTVEQTAKLLDLSVPTIYSKVSRGELPVMKRGKRLYFSKTELLDYLKAGRKKTVYEIEAEVESYFNNQ